MNEKQDLTVGGIPQKIIYLSMPILATSFINMAYNFIEETNACCSTFPSDNPLIF